MRQGSAFNDLVRLVLLVVATTSVSVGCVAAFRAAVSDFKIFYSATLEKPGTNLNPPAMTWIFGVLRWWPEHIALALWLAFGGMCLAATAFVIARRTHIAAIDFVTVILGTAAGLMTIRLGQITFVLLAIVTLAWIADRERRSKQCGLFLGVAVYLKLFLGLMLVDLVRRRAWNTLGWAVVSSSVCGIAGWLVGGWSAYARWIDTLRNISWVGHLLNASWPGFVLRVFGDTPNGIFGTPIVHLSHLQLWTLLGIVIIFGTAWWRTRHAAVDQRWACLLLTSILISPLGWFYYLPIAAGPLLACWRLFGFYARSFAMVGFLLAFVPPSQQNFVLSPVLTLTWGSVHMWSLCALWIATLFSPIRIDNVGNGTSCSKVWLGTGETI